MDPIASGTSRSNARDIGADRGNGQQRGADQTEHHAHNQPVLDISVKRLCDSNCSTGNTDLYRQACKQCVGAAGGIRHQPIDYSRIGGIGIRDNHGCTIVLAEQPIENPWLLIRHIHNGFAERLMGVLHYEEFRVVAIDKLISQLQRKSQVAHGSDIRKGAQVLGQRINRAHYRWRLKNFVVFLAGLHQHDHWIYSAESRRDLLFHLIDVAAVPGMSEVVVDRESIVLPDRRLRHHPTQASGENSEQEYDTDAHGSIADQFPHTGGQEPIEGAVLFNFDLRPGAP